jgi:hypothetical protein
MHHLASAGRRTDVDGVRQVEMRGYRRKIVGVMIHIVTVGDLAGPTVAAAIVGDNAVALIEEEYHLCIPIVGRDWAAVAEHDGLAFAPIFVENLDAVFRFDKAHDEFPFSRLWVANSKFD